MRSAFPVLNLSVSTKAIREASKNVSMKTLTRELKNEYLTKFLTQATQGDTFSPSENTIKMAYEIRSNTRSIIGKIDCSKAQ